MTNNAAANDTTETTTILRGTTLESNAWRAHRFANLIRVTSLVNAGKRGKLCEEFTAIVSGYGSDDEQLDSIAPGIAWAVLSNVSVESMRALLADTALAGFKFLESSPRGVDVPKRSEIRVEADLVRARFGETELLATFTAVHSAPSGESFRQDTIVGSQNRKDAAKAYQWAQSLDNRKRLVNMTVSAFRSEMSAIGVRIS